VNEDVPVCNSGAHGVTRPTSHRLVKATTSRSTAGWSCVWCLRRTQAQSQRDITHHSKTKKPEQGCSGFGFGGEIDYFLATGAVLATKEMARRDFLRLAVGRLTTPDLTALS